MAASRRTVTMALLSVVALVSAACAGGDGEVTFDGFTDGTDDVTPESVPQSVTATSDDAGVDGATAGDSGVPPRNCNALLTTEDAEFALAVWERDDGPLQTMRFSQGEYCIESGRDDETTYVLIEPGAATDFTAEVGPLDVAPVTVDDPDAIGDDVRWFAGSGEGTLAVMVATELGELRVRLGLGRPELSDAERLEIALELARRVLPRFPGVEAPEPLPIEVVQLDDPDVDRRTDSFVDHLLAREASGEWSRGEGLVQILSAVAGEASESATLAGVEITPTSGSPLLGLARDEIATNPDGEHTAEIERLIDELTFHRDEFDGSSSIQAFRRAAPSDECATWFDTDVCMRLLISLDLDEQFGDGKYRVFGPQPAPPAEIAGWTESQINRVLEAVEESATVLEELGTMPARVDVMLTPLATDMPTMSYGDAEDCAISVHPPIQPYNNFQFKQWIAGEMAHCFNGAAFAAQYEGGYERNLWWSAGMSIFLSNVIYPDANLEWKHLPGSLAGHELATSIFERSATNGMFFQHLQHSYTVDGIIALLQNLPADAAGQRATVAAWPEITQIYHEYLQDLSDKGVSDTGTAPPGAWKPQWSDFRPDGPVTIERGVDAFGVERIWMGTEAGSWACMDVEPTGGVLISWRNGDPGQEGEWQEAPPEQMTGMVVFAGSSTTDGGVLRITIEDVVDDPDECDEEPDEDAEDGETGQLGDTPADDPTGQRENCGGCGPSDYYG